MLLDGRTLERNTEHCVASRKESHVLQSEDVGMGDSESSRSDAGRAPGSDYDSSPMMREACSRR